MISTLYNGYDYLSMLWLKLIPFSKRGHWSSYPTVTHNTHAGATNASSSYLQFFQYRASVPGSFYDGSLLAGILEAQKQTKFGPAIYFLPGKQNTWLRSLLHLTQYDTEAVFQHRIQICNQGISFSERIISKDRQDKYHKCICDIRK